MATSLLRWALLSSVFILGAACYGTPKPSCAFRCGTGGECPSGYLCSPADGFCHVLQNSELLACDPGFLVDAPAAPDAAVPAPDAAVPDAPSSEPDAAEPDAG